MFYIYILKSKRNGRFYTGSTDDVIKRLSQHNSGQSKYTKNNRPFDLVYSEEFMTRAEAVDREKFLKSGKGRAILQSILNK